MCACVRHFVLRARTIARVVCGVQSSKNNGNISFSWTNLEHLDFFHLFCYNFSEHRIESSFSFAFCTGYGSHSPGIGCCPLPGSRLTIHTL